MFCLFFALTTQAGQPFDIKISGITGPALNNALARLELLKKSHPTDPNRFYQEAPAEIQKALEPYGYFKSKVETRQKGWFQVTPGPPIIIRKIDLTITGAGEKDPAFQNISHDLPIKLGQTLLTENYDKTKDQMLQAANDQGYLNATIEKKELRIDPKTSSAVIILHLASGARYYFGKIIFSDTPYSSRFLQRFIYLDENEPFSSKKLLKFQQDLSSSNYFKQVIVTPKIQEAKNFRVPTLVSLTAPKSKIYSIGAGYGTFTGPRLTLNAEWPRVGNGGQHFITQIKLSPVLSGLAAKYFIPGKNPLTDQFTLGVDAQKFLPENGRSISEKFSAGYLKNLHDWQHSLNFNYLIDHYEANNQPSEVSRLLFPSYSVSRIKTDDMIYPSQGSSVSFTLLGSNQHVLSSTSFVQSEIKGKYIFSPTSESRIIMRGDLGYTIVNDLKRLPLTLNFFAGGPRSVRGYPYSSIGPGRYLKIASVEYQHRITDNWSGALFYDAGTATDHFNSSLNRGDGLGLVYHSLIGPIQIYVARAESKPGKPLQIEFSIGPDF